MREAHTLSVEGRPVKTRLTVREFPRAGKRIESGVKGGNLGALRFAAPWERSGSWCWVGVDDGGLRESRETA